MMRKAVIVVNEIFTNRWLHKLDQRYSKKKHSDILSRREARFEVISTIYQEAPQIPLSFICSNFGPSRSGHLEWQSRTEPATFAKKQEIGAAIRTIFTVSGRTYGSPRVYQELKDIGFQASENSVAK